MFEERPRKSLKKVKAKKEQKATSIINNEN